MNFYKTKPIFSLDNILSEKLNYRNKLIAVEDSGATGDHGGETGDHGGHGGNGKNGDVKSQVKNFVLELINKIKNKVDINNNLADEFKANKNKIEVVFNKTFRS